MVVILAIMLIGGFSMSYAVWDKLSVTADETINIGEGTEIELAVVLAARQQARSLFQQA